MSQLALHLENGVSDFSPGDQAVVTAEWNLDHEPQAVELRLLWYTRGKGDDNLDVVQSLRIAEGARSDRKRLGIQLPDAPYSFSGRLISLVWALELMAEPSGESVRVDIVIAPEASEIRLGSAEDDDSGNDASDNGEDGEDDDVDE
jgi:hypothetical protein